MRSLQDWMKYLEEQEQSAKPRPEEETPPVRETAIQEPEVAQPVAQPEPPEPVAPPAPKVEPPKPVEQPKVELQPQQKPAATKAQAPAQPKPATPKPAQPAKPRKQRTPKALMQAVSPEEIAQSSYKPFRESREELLQRLLDPLISLEEAARILNVCPTTVRRYTNRGILQHYRTAGNQRRFRLSDVLAFMSAGTPSDD